MQLSTFPPLDLFFLIVDDLKKTYFQNTCKLACSIQFDLFLLLFTLRKLCILIPLLKLKFLVHVTINQCFNCYVTVLENSYQVNILFSFNLFFQLFTLIVYCHDVLVVFCRKTTMFNFEQHFLWLLFKCSQQRQSMLLNIHSQLYLLYSLFWVCYNILFCCLGICFLIL